MLVKDISICNPCSSDEVFSDFINYIDTASVTEGVLENVQYLTSKYPSRAKREVFQNDILISSVRPNLRHNYFVSAMKPHMVASTGFIQTRVTVPEKISPRFLYYFLTSPDNIKTYVRVASTAQSSYPSFNKDVIENMVLPNLDLPSQRHIASILGSLDEKIEVNRRKIEKLEALARLIYEHWFVQFDFPDTSGNPYKSSGGKMEWNDELKQEIPAGWDSGNLYQIAEYVNGCACQKFYAKTGEDKLPVVKIREMHEGFSSETEYVRADIPVKYKIVAGDILFSWSASLEVMIWTGMDSCLNQHIFHVIPNDGYPSLYVLMQLQAYVGNFISYANARKTTMGHITSDHIEQSCVVIPEKRILDCFATRFSGILNSIIILQQEKQKLISLRDWLLPMLMNGQVEVAE